MFDSNLNHSTAALKARTAVKRMKEYHPPLEGRVGLRLDFNENTVGCSPRVAATLRGITVEELAKYPERHGVEKKVAQFLDLDPAQVLLTNGVDEGLHLICEAYLEPSDEVIIPVPTFSMYELYAQMTGADVISIQMEDNFVFPAERILAAITPRTKLIAIANPNNPTGAAAEQIDLIRILNHAPHAAVVVDEAYFHFFGETILPEIAGRSNLFVARTFSKAYGMAGLRVGLLAGSAESMRMVRKVCSPYNVNEIALTCLEAALDDRDFITDYCAQVIVGRKRLEGELERLGVPFWPSHANFVLMKIGERHKDFVATMREGGILVRNRHSDPGCSGCVRITLGCREQTDRLLALLPKALEQIGWSADKSSEVRL